MQKNYDVYARICKREKFESVVYCGGNYLNENGVLETSPSARVVFGSLLSAHCKELLVPDIYGKRDVLGNPKKGIRCVKDQSSIRCKNIFYAGGEQKDLPE